MRIVFMGTPDFAVPSLRALAASGHEIVGVFCQPDRPQGRKMVLTACPVKQEAQKLDIPVFQFEKIRKQAGLDALRALKPDLCVSAAFGQILSQKNLDVPPLGTINVHGSLLPKLRGSAPIQWAVVQGEKVTGITIMYTSLGVDEGDIILQKQTPIGEEETAGELFDRMAVLGAEALMEAIGQIEAGTVTRTPQDASQATHCSMIQKEDARLDFTKTAQELSCLVRGMNPWPVAFFADGDRNIKVYKAKAVEGEGTPGQVLCADGKNGLVIACGQDALRIEILQAPGGKPIAAADWLRGHTLQSMQVGENHG